MAFVVVYLLVQTRVLLEGKQQMVQRLEGKVTVVLVGDHMPAQTTGNWKAAAILMAREEVRVLAVKAIEHSENLDEQLR